MLPIGAVRSMFDRARQWQLDEGGRFDPRDEAIFVWSGPPASRDPRPIGSVAVRWATPTPGDATIELIAWDREVDGALDQLCRGVELLAGALVAR